jgi:predicted acylesterase/phospholipase RssA
MNLPLREVLSCRYTPFHGEPPDGRALDTCDQRRAATTRCGPSPEARLLHRGQRESIEMSAKATLGLVLSGGGARGIAHIGVIDALRSHGFEPDCIAGSSSGAIIGALAAAGHPTETMLEFFHKASPFRLSAVAVRKAGILDTAKVVAGFREYFPDDSFEALKISSTPGSRSSSRVRSSPPSWRRARCPWCSRPPRSTVAGTWMVA